MITKEPGYYKTEDEQESYKLNQDIQKWAMSPEMKTYFSNSTNFEEELIEFENNPEKFYTTKILKEPYKALGSKEEESFFEGRSFEGMGLGDKFKTMGSNFNKFINDEKPTEKSIFNILNDEYRYDYFNENKRYRKAKEEQEKLNELGKGEK